MDAVDRGDLDAALQVYRSLVPLVDVIMHRVQGAMAAKAALQVLGVLDGRHVRLPLVPAGDDLVAEIRTVLHGAGLLEEPSPK